MNLCEEVTLPEKSLLNLFHGTEIIQYLRSPDPGDGGIDLVQQLICRIIKPEQLLHLCSCSTTLNQMGKIVIDSRPIILHALLEFRNRLLHQPPVIKQYGHRFMVGCCSLSVGQYILLCLIKRGSLLLHIVVINQLYRLGQILLHVRESLHGTLIKGSVVGINDIIIQIFTRSTHFTFKGVRESPPPYVQVQQHIGVAVDPQQPRHCDDPQSSYDHYTAFGQGRDPLTDSLTVTIPGEEIPENRS